MISPVWSHESRDAESSRSGTNEGRLGLWVTGSQILPSLDLPPSQTTARPRFLAMHFPACVPRRRLCGVGFSPHPPTLDILAPVH
jgi:hypothetical protein